MLHYKIRYIEHRGHIDDFVFDFDKDFSLLGTFLSSDVTPFEDWIKADLDEVLSGECERKEFFGNAELLESQIRDSIKSIDSKDYTTTYLNVKLTREKINGIKSIAGF